MKPKNLLFIMSDEHNRRVMAAPDTDGPDAKFGRARRRGVRFTDAYCNSPICVPSRACFAPADIPIEIGFWDNGIPYDGSVRSWAHRLTRPGHDRGLDRQAAFRGRTRTITALPRRSCRCTWSTASAIRGDDPRDTPRSQSRLKLGQRKPDCGDSLSALRERITDAAAEIGFAGCAAAAGRNHGFIRLIGLSAFPLFRVPNE